MEAAINHPEYRLVIRPTHDDYGNKDVSVRVLRRRVYRFCSGRFIPVWRDISLAYPSDYDWNPITVRAKKVHRFRLTTGAMNGIMRELAFSETLNFRGMWPQEIYVYIREFREAIGRHVHASFESLRIYDYWKTHNCSVFGAAVAMNVPLTKALAAIRLEMRDSPTHNYARAEKLTAYSAASDAEKEIA